MKRNRVCWMVGLLLWLAAVQTGWTFYNPKTGKWLSRDPIGEGGFEITRSDSAVKIDSRPKLTHGVNPYGFSGNDALDNHDYMGLAVVCCRKVMIPVLTFFGVHCEVQAGSSCTGPNGPWTSYPTQIDRSPKRAIDGGKCCKDVTQQEVDACVKRFTDLHQAALFNNCHDGTMKAIGRCCLNTKWTPSWYAGSQQGVCLRSHTQRVVTWDGMVMNIDVCDEWEFPNGFNRGLPGCGAN